MRNWSNDLNERLHFNPPTLSLSRTVKEVCGGCFLVFCNHVHCVSAEEKGGAGRSSMKDREAFDARNILEVGLISAASL